MKKIILTGGGSAGHVTPNIALSKVLLENNWEIDYIGSVDGIEKNIVEEAKISYHTISSGKLRRYFSIQNFKDPFKVIKGISDANALIKKLKPDVIFSKGGFVTAPVIIAGSLNKIPVIIHESDYTPGLANKISIPFAKKVCVSFPETLKHIPPEKGIYTGAPIRKEIILGSKEKGLEFCNFSNEKPVLLVMGGSLGSQVLNKNIRGILKRIIDKFQIIHICGKGLKDDSLINIENYKQFEFVGKELADLFACTDLFVSRAGSNAIFEFLALKKPNLLIPLSKKASRGDQILNAKSFEKQGFSKVLYEEDLDEDLLYNFINTLYKDKQKYIDKMNDFSIKDSISEIYNIILGSVK
ncbi:MAG: undecaprenyldiphospho-muramoylpentapeptide beta-N-acetylglucosaminyltransferase [Candidatus Sericytochromatia bacterium]